MTSAQLIEAWDRRGLSVEKRLEEALYRLDAAEKEVDRLRGIVALLEEGECD